jgi:putative transposase
VIKKDMLDDLLAGRDRKAVFSKDGLFDELKKALAEDAERRAGTTIFGSEAADGSGNRRNGYRRRQF